ncbi:MAG: glutamine amidotransferase [Rhodopirellula sp. JB044]|uniref:glutamine amidotransferase n=1 Tax=Rhodopirellula sp. JB044 TaxID=3342844 RepID=UPI00370BBE1E
MRLSYDPIYDSGLVGVLLTVAVVMLLFVITPKGISPRRRLVLLILRGFAALALVLTMLRPSVVRTDNRPAAATLAIAMDTSRSMTLASGDESAAFTNSGSPTTGEAATNGDVDTRWQQQDRILSTLGERLTKLDDQLNVALYRYDGSSESIASGPASDLLQTLGVKDQLRPTGVLTDLSAPLDAAVAASRGTPLAGILLLSDGTQTAGPDAPSKEQTDSPSETNPPTRAGDPIASARLVSAIGVPLWTVALGPRADTNRVQDVSVQSLPETYRMFTGNETEVSFEVQTQGYPGVPIALTVDWVNSAGVSRTAATRTVTSDAPSHTEAFRIPVVAPEPGQYQLFVRARPPAGEPNASNDSQLAFVDVRPGGGRVLYLEGTPRLEQTFLRRALRRFPDLDLTYRWIPRDTAARWPASLADDLQTGRFDVVIIGDLHSAAIGDKQLEQLADAVAAGTALVTLGGERAYGPGGYADTPLAKVLPVRMDGSVAITPGREIENRLRGQLAGPITLRPSRGHPITTIKTLGRDANWTTLPPMPGANALPGVKTNPGVQVLLEDNNEAPMLVVGEYGQGRVASLAFDSTWVWWRGGASEFHRRFWRQLMLWLLSREDDRDNELQLEMTRRRFSTSQSSLLSGSISLSPDTAARSENWSAEVVMESGEKRPLNITANTRTNGDQRETIVNAEILGAAIEMPSANNASNLPDDGTSPALNNQAKFAATASSFPPGVHRVRVRLGDPSNPTVAAELPFQIVDDTRELSVIAADHALLERIAAMTKESGGAAFRPDQLDKLVDQITAQRRRAERAVIQKWRLGDDPASGWILFTLFAGCLCSEWTLRRRWGLA